MKDKITTMQAYNKAVSQGRKIYAIVGNEKREVTRARYAQSAFQVWCGEDGPHTAWELEKGPADPARIAALRAEREALKKCTQLTLF